MLELLVKLRPETGRGNKQIRKQGFIPAILYGRKIKNLALSVKAQDFEKVYQEAGESTLIKLKIEEDQNKAKSAKGGSPSKDGQAAPGGKERVVLIHEIANDPVSDEPIHIDFYQVKMDEPIKAEVPLVFVGESPAVKEATGVLVKNIQSLEVEALPQDLPHQIEVDISSLKTVDNKIHIKDLKLSAGVKTEVQPEEVVVLVILPRTKAELEKLEETPEEKIEEVEMVEKKKAGEEVKEEAVEETESTQEATSFKEEKVAPDKKEK